MSAQATPQSAVATGGGGGAASQPLQGAVARHAGDGSATGGSTRLGSLNPSLLQDLRRFECQHQPGEGLDLLEVLAAALRHGRPLQVQLQLDYRTIPLTVLPHQRLLRGPLTLAALLALRLPELRVLQVAPADPPTADDATWATAPLAPLLWELALRGAREALLPEIAGVAAYRVVPGADLHVLDVGGSLADAIARLRRQATPLRQIAAWPAFDRQRAMRLLNALYLQSALMVSRSHPSAIGGA